jgi:hypothetical protein
MGGCGCGGASASDATKWKVAFSDGSQLNKTFPDQLSAQIALQQSGKTGEVKKA